MKAGSLRGKRILIVEDEYLIATDLMLFLQEEDAIVIGPTGDLTQGLALSSDPLDAALLDVSLEGGTSFGIAEQLDARSVPYLFLTGHDASAMPENFRAMPRLTKPFAHTAVLRGMETIMKPEVSA